MFEAQNIMDLQESSGFGDPKSWLSGEAGDAHTGAGGNVDRVLYNDLVQMVPLVQSLIDRKATSSYTRRGSMVYTKTPSRESMTRKGRNAAQSMPAKKKRDNGDRELAKNDQDGDNFSGFSLRDPEAEKEREELLVLRGQLEEFQLKLSEKENLLQSAEIAQTNLLTQLEELRRESAEKDSLIKSIQLQLSDAKIKLADKQAALEKTKWEAMTSQKRVEMLEEELSNTQGEVSSFMSLLEGLNGIRDATHCEDYDLVPYCVDEHSTIDDLDASAMQQMEEARLAYIAALAFAEERQDEESMAVAAKARLHLQSLVFGAE